MKYINGDLIEMFKNNEFDIIVHGCNCFNNMGAGIALQIKNKYPKAYHADCKTEKGSKDKLGTYTFEKFNEGIIINAYTQYHYGSGKNGTPMCDYESISKVFDLIKKEFPNANIGIPLIGAGLAKGDWSIISKIIESKNMNITCVKYNK